MNSMNDVFEIVEGENSIDRFCRLFDSNVIWFNSKINEEAHRLFVKEINTYSLEDINKIVNRFGGDVPIVEEIHCLLNARRDRANITFNPDTLECIQNKWPETYQLIQKSGCFIP